MVSESSEVKKMRKFIKAQMKLGGSKSYALGYQAGLKRGKKGYFK